VLADKLREQRTALVGGTDPRADLRALVAGPKFDRANAQTMVEAKTAAVRGKSPEVITAAADFFDSLKPDQQQQVRDFMGKRRGWGRRG
jgi:periplasmic protein CpxP/Spy